MNDFIECGFLLLRTLLFFSKISSHSGRVGVVPSVECLSALECRTSFSGVLHLMRLAKNLGSFNKNHYATSTRIPYKGSWISRVFF